MGAGQRLFTFAVLVKVTPSPGSAWVPRAEHLGMTSTRVNLTLYTHDCDVSIIDWHWNHKGDRPLAVSAKLFPEMLKSGKDSPECGQHHPIAWSSWLSKWQRGGGGGQKLRTRALLSRLSYRRCCVTSCLVPPPPCLPHHT